MSSKLRFRVAILIAAVVFVFTCCFGTVQTSYAATTYQTEVTYTAPGLPEQPIQATPSPTPTPDVEDEKNSEDIIFAWEIMPEAEDNKSENTEIVDNPKTGDNSPSFWTVFIIPLLSFIALVIFYLLHKKRGTENEQ